MPIPALAFKAVISVGGVGVTVGSGGAAIYYGSKVFNKTSIFSTKQLGAPTTKTSSTSSFILATINSVAINISAQLYDSAKSSKNFACQYWVDETKTQTDDFCEIYYLNGTVNRSSNKDILDLPNAIKDGLKIKNKSNLSSAKNFIVKLSKDIADQLSTNTKKTFKLVNKSGNNEVIAELTWKFNIANNVSTSSMKSIGASNIFAIKLTKDFSNKKALTFQTPLVCKIGSTETTIPCKLYKYTSSVSPYTHESLKSIDSSIAINDSSIKKDSYLIVELSQEKTKSFQELDNQLITIKDGEDEIAQGLLDNLLIGLTSDKANFSHLFKLPDLDDLSTPAEPINATKNFIITKGTLVHQAIKDDLADEGYLCRVVDGTTKYDDDSCKLFTLGSTPKETAFAYKPADLGPASTKKLTKLADLGVDKYQFVQLSKTLIEKLTGDKKLQVIKTANKDKAFNNKIVELTKHSDFSKGSESLTNLNANLFLARIASKETNASTKQTAISAGFTLAITGTSEELDVKVFKFSTNQNTNKKSSVDFATIDSSITPNTDLAKDHFVVIELTKNWKSIGYLKNKELVLKTKDDKKTLAKLEYSQILFGNPSSADVKDKFVFPHEVETDTYIVKKTQDSSDLVSTAFATPYRCSLASKDNKHKNLDDTCKLISIALPTGNKSLITFNDLKTANTEATATVLSTADNVYYKLEVDRNKLFNLTFPETAPSTISIELVPTVVAENPEVYGTFNIEHKLENNIIKGSTNLFLVKVKTTTPTATAPIDGTAVPSSDKCSLTSVVFNSVASTNGQDCTLHVVTPVTASTFDNLTITDAAKTAGAMTQGNYHILKFTTPQSLENLPLNASVYHHVKDTSNTANVHSTHLTIVGWMGGEIGNSKKPHYLSAVSTTSAK